MPAFETASCHWNVRYCAETVTPAAPPTTSPDPMRRRSAGGGQPQPDHQAAEVLALLEPDRTLVDLGDRGVRLDTGKPGTGLGMAIVRDVAEIYEGTVGLEESEDLGGLMVRLRLPAAS